MSCGSGVVVLLLYCELFVVLLEDCEAISSVSLSKSWTGSLVFEVIEDTISWVIVLSAVEELSDKDVWDLSWLPSESPSELLNPRVLLIARAALVKVLVVSVERDLEVLLRGWYWVVRLYVLPERRVRLG